MSTSISESRSVETLHGLAVTEKKVTITVTSNGCTDKSDFKIEVQESLPPIVTFIRVKPDNCRAISRSVDICFSLKEVGTTKFKVANSFAPGPPRLQ